MDRSNLSLKWLEVFQAVARSGSLRDGAKGLGISVSTASHHLTCLEKAVGADLLDHNKRPMSLTIEGQLLLKRVDEAMWLLRMGLSEVWSEDISQLHRLLRIAHIDDFDPDVGPELIDHLSRFLPSCDFSVFTRPSHEILDLLQSERLDIGLATTADHEIPGLSEDPVLRDPFLIVLPKDTPLPTTLGDLETLSQTLPLLRYSKTQVIGRRVEAQLRRMGLRLPDRMEFESTHTILSLVAAGRGWTITTAMNHARARRYQDSTRAIRFVGTAFVRNISVFWRNDLPARIPDLVTKLVRGSLQSQIIEPTLAARPWLDGQFHILPKPPQASERPHGEGTETSITLKESERPL